MNRIPNWCLFNLNLSFIMFVSRRNEINSQEFVTTVEASLPHRQLSPEAPPFFSSWPTSTIHVRWDHKANGNCSGGERVSVRGISEALEVTDLCEALSLRDLAVTRHWGGSSKKKKRKKNKICLPRQGSSQPSWGKITKTGTTIKDTWTKPRGRVERGEGGGFTWGGVEGWGEKAYNCNWITIKKKKITKTACLAHG